MQHIGSLTAKWIEMSSLLGNIKILFKHHPDVRSNKLVNYFTAVNFGHHETFLRKGKGNNTDTTFKKLVAIENTISLLKQKKLNKNNECFIEARVIFEIYNSCLTNANSPKEM